MPSSTQQNIINHEKRSGDFEISGSFGFVMQIIWLQDIHCTADGKAAHPLQWLGICPWEH